jgi:hypothetical protein
MGALQCLRGTGPAVLQAVRENAVGWRASVVPLCEEHAALAGWHEAAGAGVQLPDSGRVCQIPEITQPCEAIFPARKESRQRK